MRRLAGLVASLTFVALVFTPSRPAAQEEYAGSDVWTLAYHVREDLTLKFYYGYEKFDLTNFKIDDLTPFGPPTRAESDVFLADRIDDYKAHILALSVEVKF